MLNVLDLNSDFFPLFSFYHLSPDPKKKIKPIWVPKVSETRADFLTFSKFILVCFILKYLEDNRISLYLLDLYL